MSQVSRNALVALSDPSMARDISDTLAKLKQTSTVVSGSQQVLRELQDPGYRLVILDSDVKPIGGFELAKLLRLEYPTRLLNIVLMTDGSWNETRRAVITKQYGLDRLLIRPLSTDSLIRAIEPLLHRTEWNLWQAFSSNVPSLIVPTTQSAEAIRGDLAQIPVPVVLGSFHRMRVEGALILTNQTHKVVLSLSQGDPMAFQSNLRTRFLGEVLLQERLIDESTLNKSLRRIKRSGRKQGVELVEMQALSPRQVRYGLELQLRANYLDLFTWRTGEFVFLPDKIDAEMLCGLSLSTETILVDGIRQHWTPLEIDRVLSPYGQTVAIRSNRARVSSTELVLDSLEQALLESCDGERTLREVMQRSPLPRSRVLPTLFAFLSLGVVTLSERLHRHTVFATTTGASSPAMNKQRTL